MAFFKNAPVNAMIARFKLLLLGLLLTLSVATAAAWAVSYYRPDAWIISGSHHVWNLGNNRGRILITVFSAIPEDETYWTFNVQHWMIESATVLATAFVGWRVLKARRARNAHGFPV